MKRHIQTTDERLWAGEDLCELQAEPLEALEKFFKPFENMIISGCEVSDDKLSEGLVALNGFDHKGNSVYKVAPVKETTDLIFPVYVYLKCTVENRIYGNGEFKPVREIYTAELSNEKPETASYLTIHATGESSRFKNRVTPSQKITLLNIQSGIEKWEPKADLPIARYSHGSAVINGKIYLIGGSTNRNDCYDPATNTWSTKANIPTARQNLSLSVVKNKIYAIGGSAGSTKNTVECYDPATDSWTTKSPMPTARTSAAAAVVKDIIYVIGGNSNVLECYNPETDSWTTKKAMPTARRDLTVAVFNNKIYAIGGSDNSATTRYNVVECYDPETDSWTTKSPMPTARVGLTSGVIGNKIYVIGGYLEGGIASNKNECYDPVSNKWSEKKEMITAGYYFTSSIVNNKMYVFGGSYRHSKNECYESAELKTLKVLGNSTMQFDKNVLWNNELKPANIPFKTVGPGILSLIETDVSGEIDKSLNITYTNL